MTLEQLYRYLESYVKNGYGQLTVYAENGFGEGGELNAITLSKDGETIVLREDFGAPFFEGGLYEVDGNSSFIAKMATGDEGPGVRPNQYILEREEGNGVIQTIAGIPKNARFTGTVVPITKIQKDENIQGVHRMKSNESSANDVDWKSIFADVVKKHKDYLATDLSPWLTETYSKAEKKEYLKLKSKAVSMPKDEIYLHLADSKIWQRVSREEMNRRNDKKYRAPKHPSHEYDEPETCPWCGRESMEKQEDGNYHCTWCGYDHLKERNAYNWDD